MENLHQFYHLGHFSSLVLSKHENANILAFLPQNTIQARTTEFCFGMYSLHFKYTTLHIMNKTWKIYIKRIDQTGSILNIANML